MKYNVSSLLRLDFVDSVLLILDYSCCEKACIKELGKEKIIISFSVNLALVQKHINEEERWLLDHAGFWNPKRLVILFANLTERDLLL